MDPLIITTAVVGGELSKQDTPYLPITPEEIAEESVASAQAGSTVIHLHARDELGEPKHDPALFRAIQQNIQKRCQELSMPVPILQFSTGGSIGMSLEERSAPLECLPDMATVTMGSINFGRDIFENSLDTIEFLIDTLQNQQIGIEAEIFEAGMVDNVRRLLDQQKLQQCPHFNFVLGVPGTMTGEIENLQFLISRIPDGANWTVSGIGKVQFSLACYAIEQGGHVRTGLEDNRYLSKGNLAPGNASLVKKVVDYAQECNRPIATLEQARGILGLTTR